MKQPNLLSMSAKSQTFTLQRSWKHFFWSYLLAVLAIPLLGAGFIALYFLRQKRKAIIYTMTDTQIIATDGKYEQHVDLVDIEKLQLQQSSLHAKLGVGNLLVHSSTATMTLAGIEEPQQIKNILEQAIGAQQKHRQRQKISSSPRYQPGSMPKLDYLTGLWQQGLISDEDYEAERKHFE